MLEQKWPINLQRFSFLSVIRERQLEVTIKHFIYNTWNILESVIIRINVTKDAEEQKLSSFVGKNLNICNH